MTKIIFATFIALISACATAHTTIPANDTPIYLQLNAKPVEVRDDQVHRYRCAHGKLVAVIELGGRTNRRMTLRCIN